MGLVKLTDRRGVTHAAEGVNGDALMPHLRKLKVGIVGLCGGNAACGTCHVHVAPDWVDRVGPPVDEFEEELLAELDNRQPNSRLTCQIPFTAELDGVELTVATTY